MIQVRLRHGVIRTNRRHHFLKRKTPNVIASTPVYSELMHIHPAKDEICKALSNASLSTDDSFNCDAGTVE